MYFDSYPNYMVKIIHTVCQKNHQSAEHLHAETKKVLNIHAKGSMNKYLRIHMYQIQIGMHQIPRIVIKKLLIPAYMM